MNNKGKGRGTGLTPCSDAVQDVNKGTAGEKAEIRIADSGH